ncbi:MAG: ABC transporter substrate-binding protein [Deltaproteobacteria bacterium]
MKRIVVALLILVMGIGLIGCGQEKTGPAPKDGPGKAVVEKTITIGVMPDVESIPFIIAEKNGYFKKEGVKVELQHFRSAKDRDSALQGGKLDGMITDVLAVVFANEGGIKMRIVSRNDGNIELMAGKNSGIKSVKDLKGRTIGMSTNTIMEYTADQMLIAGGVKPEEVKKVAIPPLPTRFEMLQGGRVDAAILPEPLAGLAVKGGAAVLNSSDAMANKPGAIAFTAESIQQYPGEVKAVFRAYNDAVDYLAKEPAESYIDYVIKSQGFPEGVKGSLKLPAYQKAAKPDQKIFDDVVKWLKAKQLVKGEYKYQDIVDDTILR